jgi:glycosyltransferase involved in cell wall biosynthesis
MKTPSYPKRLAIVPAYNEEEMIFRVVKSIRKHASDFDIVVIDDGSTDKTAEEAERAGATVLRHPFNLGIGGAVQSGFFYAMVGDYDLAVQVDGDGQHDPVYLPEFIERFEKAPYVDVVCGTRFREGPGYKVPRHRRMGMLIFSWVLSALVRQHITDPTSGFRMMNRRGIELFARDYPHDYPEVEAILMMKAHRLQLREHPVKMRVRGGGRSSITHGQSMYYMVKVLLAVFIGLFRRRPAIEAGADAAVQAQPSL